MKTHDPNTCPKSILYVEESFNLKINKFIVENYEQIVKDFSEDFHINFLYLPYVLKDEFYIEQLQYNHPTFDPAKLDDTDIHAIYQDLINGEGKSGIGCSLLSYEDEKSEKSDHGYELNAEKDLIAQFYNFAKESRELTIENANRASKFMQFIAPNEFKILKEELEDLFGGDYQTYLDKIEKGSVKNINIVCTALTNLNNGLNKSSQVLSRLQITGKKGNYKVYLTDITNPSGPKEVKMGPLPMTLLVFFLNRPNGMKFTDLQNHINSLNNIYCELSKSMPSNADYISSSIKKLVHSKKVVTSLYYNDSILTREFTKVISPVNAKYYHITGSKGKIRKIILPRNLVDMAVTLQGL